MPDPDLTDLPVGPRRPDVPMVNVFVTESYLEVVEPASWSTKTILSPSAPGSPLIFPETPLQAVPSNS